MSTVMEWSVHQVQNSLMVTYKHKCAPAPTSALAVGLLCQEHSVSQVLLLLTDKIVLVTEQPSLLI